MFIEYVCVYNSCLSYIQEEHTAVIVFLQFYSLVYIVIKKFLHKKS